MDTNALTHNADFDAACRRHRAEIDQLDSSFRSLQVDMLRWRAEQGDLVSRAQQAERVMSQLADVLAGEAGIPREQRDALFAELEVMTFHGAFNEALPAEIGGLL